MSSRLLQAETGSIVGNPGAPTPVAPFPHLESGEIIIRGVFRMFMSSIISYSALNQFDNGYDST
jgi:hypothetical protein